MASQIQLRRDTAAGWLAVNPVLALGEPGFETDTFRFKLGDNVHSWRALQYYGEGVGLIRSVSFSFPAFVQGVSIGQMAWSCPSIVTLKEIYITSGDTQDTTIFDVLVNGSSIFPTGVTKPTLVEGTNLSSTILDPAITLMKNDGITINCLGGMASSVNVMIRYI